MSKKNRITTVKTGDEVKRNPDKWIWGDQDGNGKGSIIFHKQNSPFPLIVKWHKTAIKNSYKYEHLLLATHSSIDDLLDALDEMEEKLST